MQNQRSALALAAVAAIMLSACSSDTNTTTQVVGSGNVTATFVNSQSPAKPVAGATVTVSPDPGAICAPTAADGTWSCTLPSGAYTLTVSGTGVTTTAFNVNVFAGATAALGTKVVPYSPIVLRLATPQNALAAGFNSSVTVNATITGGTPPLTVTWGPSNVPTTAGRAAPAAWAKNTAYTQYVRVQNGGKVYECATSGTSAASGTGPSSTTSPVADNTVSWTYLGALPAGPAISLSNNNLTGTFTTEPFATIANAANLIVRNQDFVSRPGVVGITVGDGEFMGYKVPVNVVDANGYTQNASILIYPANFSHGTANNPVGAMVVLTDGDMPSGPSGGRGAPFAAYNWSFLSKPAGSTATLHDATTQYAWFIPDKVGDYSLTSGAVPAWAAGATYAAGAYVQANGGLYKCKTGGTSAASGTGPSGMGTLTTGSSTPGAITDGTVSWTYQEPYGPIVVHADTFSGVSVCATCHGTGGMAAAPKPQYTAWTTSGHPIDKDLNNGASGASLFQNELLGLEHGASSCLRCHTTGNDPGQTGNKGFSDNATADGWVYPAGTVAWSTVPANLKQFDGVQCESCHGPVGIASGGGHAPAVSYNASLCGRCHDYNVGSHHDRYSLWSLSPTGHSRRDLPLRGAADRSLVNLTADATTGYLAYGAASCARCHTAQGFAAYVKQQLNGGATDDTDPCYAGAASGDYLANYACFLNDPSVAVASQTTAGLSGYLVSTLGLTASNVEPQTCQACHDPHTTGLRIEDDTHVLPGGFRVQGAGAGALCMMCHNSRNGARGDAITTFPKTTFTINSVKTAVRAVGTPHDSTAAEIFTGHNAFFTDASVQNTGKHFKFLGDTCVDCHVNINVGNLSLQSKAPNHAFKVEATAEFCANCHAAAADQLTDPTIGIQAQFDAMMGTSTTGLSGAIASAYMAAATNLHTGLEGNVQVVGSSGNQTAVFPLTAITQVTGPAIDNSSSGPSSSQVVIYLNAPVNDPTKASGTTTKIVASMTSVVWVTTDQLGTANQGGRPIIDPAGLLVRAIYNNMLLTNDGSKGVHNWSYVQNVITNTTNVLNAYSSTGALPTINSVTLKP